MAEQIYKDGKWQDPTKVLILHVAEAEADGEEIEARIMTASEFLEREVGGPHHRAIVIADLQSAASAAAEEFNYDEGPEEYVALCRRLAEWEPVKFDA